MKGTGLLFVGLLLVAIGIIGLVLLYSGIINLGISTNTPAERGAWIFNTGTDPNGQPLAYSGGMTLAPHVAVAKFSHSHAGVMRASCASCHGANGRGLRTPMFISPNITYRNLTDPAGMVETDGGRGMTYTDDLIRRAVTQGIDAEGKPLALFMPRWQLTDAEWNDLIAYLKTLP